MNKRGEKISRTSSIEIRYSFCAAGAKGVRCRDESYTQQNSSSELDVHVCLLFGICYLINEFVTGSLSFHPFPFGHYAVWPSPIFHFGLSLQGSNSVRREHWWHRIYISPLFTVAIKSLAQTTIPVLPFTNMINSW